MTDLKNTRSEDSINGKKVAILGLGLEGKDVLNFIKSKASQITVFDKTPLKNLDLDNVDVNGIEFITGEDYLKNGLRGFDIIFRSPGFYRYLPEIIEAENKGAEITSSTKIFFKECKARTIGITGTKGKGTTSTLIYKILKDAGRDVYLAGNIGTPSLKILEKLKKDSIVVLELSSFQLIDLKVSPNISVVLNITSDHMDWHKDVNEYIKAKENIVMFQNDLDVSVINYDYDIPRNFSKITKAEVFFYSRKEVLEKGAFVDGENNIVFTNEKTKSNLGKIYRLLLRGEHNLENVLPATVVAKVLGVSDDIIEKTISSFKGLEHRLELVRNVGGVTFYNDSFATGPQPTIAAVKAFKEPITLILGGSEKYLNYDELARIISKSKNVKVVALIGQIAPQIKESLLKSKFKGKILELGKNPMKKIVHETFKLTPKGGVVLFSPAAASFDMFKNYKERGKKFKESVENLAHGQ